MSAKTALLALLLTVLSAQPGWTRFESDNQFAISYPPGWHQILGGTNYLDAINVPDSERREGIVIPPWGAELHAAALMPSKRSLRDWMKGRLHGAKPTVDREFQIAAAEPNACRTLHQIKYLENINPGGKPEYMNWTEFYCQINGHQFGIFVDYFSDNRNSEALDASAFEVAKSLRVCNGSSGRESCGHDDRE